MTQEYVVTILGCGVAGSWMAHHLCNRGYKRFLLFGGAQPGIELLNIGPVSEQKSKSTTAELLADHLKSMSADLKVTVYGNYVPEEHNDILEGTVVGTMGAMRHCMEAYREARERGLKWISIGLPSTPEGSVAIVTDPNELDPDEHFGVTHLSRDEANSVCAEFASSIASESV